MRPKAKRNGIYGYRAMVEFDDGRESIVVSKVLHPAKYLAENTAKEWIELHKDDPEYRDTTSIAP